MPSARKGRSRLQKAALASAAARAAEIRRARASSSDPSRSSHPHSPARNSHTQQAKDILLKVESYEVRLRSANEKIALLERQIQELEHAERLRTPSLPVSLPLPSQLSNSSPETTPQPSTLRLDPDLEHVSRLELSKASAVDKLRNHPYERTFRFQEKDGVISQAARSMIRELSDLGVPHAKIMQTARTVFRTAGVSVDGDIDQLSVSRIALEGYYPTGLQGVDHVREPGSENMVARIGEPGPGS
ncbi:hypothetical protein FA95DRAFT_1558461 [Auriscalpium vulgare]|uniref:Uncharacterized protein n=1 Tax=Auriscalpium vulgare TaxID=40419 RepID=A0ACB8RX13_9AGAM|nr:hypothetical protein FA95DRAFT_1558461 [Auriscalpium vulgare]